MATRGNIVTIQPSHRVLQRHPILPPRRIRRHVSERGDGAITRTFQVLKIQLVIRVKIRRRVDAAGVRRRERRQAELHHRRAGVEGGAEVGGRRVADGVLR